MARKKRPRKKSTPKKAPNKTSKKKHAGSSKSSTSPAFVAAPAMDAILHGADADTTGRIVIVFRDEIDSLAQLEKAMANAAGIKNLVTSRDFETGAISHAAMESAGGALFGNLNMAVLEAGMHDLNSLRASLNDSDSLITSIEPEYYAYHCASQMVPMEYLTGYRDAINDLVKRFEQGGSEDEFPQFPGNLRQHHDRGFVDTDENTWGVLATGVDTSKYTGKGCRIAILDTGMDLSHPDFQNRGIRHESFSGVPVDDEFGHGTHCVGTACGPAKPKSGVRRYGVASEAEIFVGQVFDQTPRPFGPRATTGDVVAGIEWAVSNDCQIVSLSLGVRADQQLAQYRVPIRRAIKAGSLVIAAAGNNANRTGLPGFNPNKPMTSGFVEPPANANDAMAVGAISRHLHLAAFSARSSQVVGNGGEVDIVGPGMGVFSSLPVKFGRHASYNGTSMATPHVAGIAALRHEATGAKGQALWHQLISTARALNIDKLDVGAGLVQAPQ